MKKRKNLHKHIVLGSLAFLLLTMIGFGFYLADYWNLIPEKSYTAEQFGITTIQSPVDYNGNGVDDYTDILLGARKDATIHPSYNGQYYDGGYPPDDIGVCTDVIWRAFRNAGYCLREMVDNDIIYRPETYKAITVKDDNIDFRRVVNLKAFFEAYAISLTLDPVKIEEWQAGDIIIWGETKHIGIVSDKRNCDGQVYVLHNAGQPNREEDALTRMNITGHYRFDASLIDENFLVCWYE